MKEKIKQDFIQEFEPKIKEYEDVLFGMNLYFQGMCFMWKDKKEIIDLNRRSYENIKQRMSSSINKANQLLEEIKSSDKLSFFQKLKLKRFKFPPIEGHPILDEGTMGAKTLAKAYKELFPNRPRNKPLTEEEFLRLKEAALKSFEDNL